MTPLGLLAITGVLLAVASMYIYIVRQEASSRRLEPGIWETIFGTTGWYVEPNHFAIEDVVQHGPKRKYSFMAKALCLPIMRRQFNSGSLLIFRYRSKCSIDMWSLCLVAKWVPDSQYSFRLDPSLEQEAMELRRVMHAETTRTCLWIIGHRDKDIDVITEFVDGVVDLVEAIGFHAS